VERFKTPADTFQNLMLLHPLSISGQIDWHASHLREANWSLRRRKTNLPDPHVGSCRKPIADFFLHQHTFCMPGGTRNDFNMTIPKLGEVDPDNVNNVTMEDLNDT
jgi:hypothetical protein